MPRPAAGLEAVQSPAMSDPASQPVQLSPRPLVSALITSHNYAAYLAAAIDSALAQTHAPIEVLVVDDGSTDASREILAAYGTRIRVLLKPQGGQASAFNAGFTAARGEIICLLDADDLWLPEKVARVVEVHREGYGLVCHDVRLRCEDGETAPAASPGLLASTLPRRGHVLAELLAAGADWPFSATSGMSITAAVARALLPLPEADWPVCADNPVAYGAAYLGPIATIEDVLGVYRMHGRNRYMRLSDRDSWIVRFRAVEDPARRLCFLEELARRRGGPLPRVDLRDRYSYCREWSFLTRPFPVLDLPRLARAKLAERRAAGTPLLAAVGCLVWDALAAIWISLGLASPWSELRRRYAPRRTGSGRLPPPVARS